MEGEGSVWVAAVVGLGRELRGGDVEAVEVQGGVGWEGGGWVGLVRLRSQASLPLPVSAIEIFG